VARTSLEALDAISSPRLALQLSSRGEQPASSSYTPSRQGRSVNLRRTFYLIRASGLSLIDIRRLLSYDRAVNNNLLTSVVIFFVVLVVATVTAWRIPSGPRRREGHRRDPLQNGSADGEHITD